jgi:CO/xanthine dehydrogenase FAD-binding subunit
MLRGKEINEKVIKETGQVASEETRPRSRSEYRKRMTSVLVRKALKEAWEKLH